MHHDLRLSSVKLPLTTRDTSAYFFMKIRSTALTITLSCTRCIIHNTAKGWTDAGTRVKSTLWFWCRNNRRAWNQTCSFQNTRTHTYTLLWTICNVDESDYLTIWGNVAFSFHPNEWLQVLEAVSLSVCVCVVARLWDETAVWMSLGPINSRWIGVVLVAGIFTCYFPLCSAT